MFREELLEKVDVLLGGQAAEKLVFGDISTGAQNDLQKATEIVRSMVTLYGMDERLGHVAYQAPRHPYLQAQPYAPQREISEETARIIDEQVRDIMEERMEGVLLTLKMHENLLQRVAERLIEKETIERDEFLELIGRKQPEQAVV